MVQALSPKDEAGSTTSSVGRTGLIVWRTCSLLLIVVSTIMQVGLTVLMNQKLDQQIQRADSLAFGRHSLSLGLLPQSQVNISGASRISGTTSAIEQGALGLADLSCLGTSLATKNFVYADPKMAPSQPWISPRPATESPATLSDSTSGATRRWYWPFKRHVPASSSKTSAKTQIDGSR